MPALSDVLIACDHGQLPVKDFTPDMWVRLRDPFPAWERAMEIEE